MKTNMIVKQVVAGLALATFIGSTSMAAAGNVILSGSVEAITTLTPTATQPLGATLGSEGLTDFAVTTVTERNNVTAGYKVTVSSANALAAGTTNMNASTLICAANPATPIPYTMKYGGVAVVLVETTGACVFTRATTVNTPDGIEKVLAVTTLPATAMHAGIYTDTITLTIAAL